MEVVLYTTHCPICEMLKSKLEEKRIKYTENTDVEEMQKLGFTSVPVLSVDGSFYKAKEAFDYLNRI